MQLLVILPRIPYPLEKGDKLRAFHQIRILSGEFDIVLIATGRKKEITEEAYRQLDPYCKEVHFLTQSSFRRIINTLWFFLKGKPLQSGYFYSAKAKRLIKQKADAKQADHVYCQLFRTAEMVRTIPLPKSIDYQDAFAASMKKRMKATSGIKKWLLSLEYKRISRYEKDIHNDFDLHTVISETDRQLMDLPDIHIVRNGVDTDFFKPMEEESEYDLIFSGNMSYLPNVHTAIYIVREIMPLIWKIKPGCRLILAGANPDRRVSMLAGERITVTGWIDDIRIAYSKSKVFIAPMQIGTGLQNKILEAMAMELPCISSQSAWKPIGASPEKEIMVAGKAEDFSDKALKLLDDEHKRQNMGKAARQFVISEFNWQACTGKLTTLIKKVPIKNS